MAAIDDFQSVASGLESPGRHAIAVTPSDSVTLAHASRGIYIGGAGDLKVITVGGETVTFASMAAGIVYPICVTQVLATGTTATGIVALY